MHKKPRSKELVNMLYNLNFAASYDKISTIKYDVARAVKKRWKPMKEYTYSSTYPVYFAIDNTDSQIDTADGKQQLHGTAMTIYQQKDHTKKEKKIEITRKST